VIGLLLITGDGKREAPMIVFFASLVAVPAVILLNCWVLFVSWRRPSRLLASALVLPALVLLGSVLFIHGSESWQELGMLLLAPFLMVPMNSLGLVAILWLLAIVVLVYLAKHLSTTKLPH
jgi:hypothetical protein